MYLLYRLGRSAKLQRYMSEATVFVLVVSLLPVIIPLTILVGFTWPVSFLSWPALPVGYYGALFLTMYFEISNRGEYLATAFLWLLFVNALGAFVGFWVGKEHRIQLFDSKWWKVLWGFVGVTLTLGIVVSVYLEPSFTYAIDWHVGFTLIGFGIILLETIFFSWLIDKIRISHPRKKVLDYVKIRYRRKRKKREG
jgi:hypothetical protein